MKRDTSIETVIYDGVSARSPRALLPLFRSNTLREILAVLLATGWMAIAAEGRASGAAMA
jgi:hypothetical protein